ncbi:MAG TPA: SagB family peptide dehydrogenase [Solirubrobacteraceae bacterium]|jgi:SagB-type dehydrogenase family enzyme
MAATGTTPDSYRPLEFSWHARAGVEIAGRGDAELEVTVEGDTTSVLRPGSPALTATLSRFGAAPGITETELIAAAGDDVGAIARSHYALRRFIANGMLVCAVSSGATVLATVIPRRRDFTLQPRPAVPVDAILSRFAYLRRIGEHLVLARPGAACELALHGAEPAAWFAAAAEPIAVAATGERADERAALYALAFAHGLLEPAGEPEPAARAAWEFHDRLFHHASRWFDDLIVRGGTFRFGGSFESPGAIRPVHPGEDIELPAVEPSESESLAVVMNRRRSRRQMSDRPVPLAAVAELMYRVARVTGRAEIGPQETIRRPYPSGGSLHELEFYLAVGACDGLAPGFYHYRGDAHRLTMLPDAGEAADAMLTMTAQGWDQPGHPPQVLVVIASRLPRIAWKYAGIAYRATLLNAGVAIGNLYLVATDLGLACCAVGTSDPGLFARATGCDLLEETSVAEFGFGVPAEGT